MCGIIGILATRPVAISTVDALKREEQRAVTPEVSPPSRPVTRPAAAPRAPNFHQTLPLGVMLSQGCRQAAVRFHDPRSPDLGLRHRLLRRPDRQVLVRALRPAPRRDRYRLGIPLPPSRPGNLALFVSQAGETRRYAGDAALCARAEAACDVDRQRRPRPIVRESDVVRPTLGGSEIGVASTEAFACQLNVLACLAIAAGRRLSSSMNTEVGPGGSKGQSRSVPMDARMLDSRPSTTVRAAQGERRRTNWHLPCRKAENTRICATFGSY
jgi:hypothetical protein